MTEKYLLEKLVEQGQKMRDAQKAFFRYRSKTNLEAAKLAEKEFDNALFNTKQLLK